MFRLIFFFSLIILSFLGSRKFQEVEEELSINPKRREERAAVNFFSWKGYRKVLFRTPNPGSVFFFTHLVMWRYYEYNMKNNLCMKMTITQKCDYIGASCTGKSFERKMWTNIILFGILNLSQTWNTSTVKSLKKAPLQPCPL